MSSVGSTIRAPFRNPQAEQRMDTAAVDTEGSGGTISLSSLAFGGFDFAGVWRQLVLIVIFGPRCFKTKTAQRSLIQDVSPNHWPRPGPNTTLLENPQPPPPSPHPPNLGERNKKKLQRSLPPHPKAATICFAHASASCCYSSTFFPLRSKHSKRAAFAF